MVVPIIVGLLAIPIIFKNVPQPVFSLFLLSLGAVNFAPTLDLGVARTAQRRIAFAKGASLDRRAALVRHSLRLAIGVGIIAGGAVGVAALFLFPHQARNSGAAELAVVTGVAVAVAIYANCQRGILEGLGAFSNSAVNRVIVGVLLVAAPVAVSFFVKDATAMCVAALAIRFSFVWEQQRAIRAALGKAPAGEEWGDHLTRGFIRESAWWSLLSVLAVAMSGFDRYILIAWGGLAGQPLTVFLATQDLALRAIALPSALLPALTVRLAANAGAVVTRSLSRRLFLMIVPGALFGCLIGVAASQLAIQILFSRLPLAPATSSLQILFIGIAASAVAQFPMARLTAAGQVRDAALMHLIEFVIFMAAMPYLVTKFSVAGGAILWSGRIVLDAVLLIAWSAFRHRDWAATRWEAFSLAMGVGAIWLAGALI